MLYDTSNQARWASNTPGNPGAFLNMQDDGNVVVYRAGSTSQTANNALWATNTVDHTPPPGGGFIPPEGGEGEEGEEGDPGLDPVDIR